MKINLFAALILMAALISMPILSHDILARTKADRTAEKVIERALEKYTSPDRAYSQYCDVTVTTKDKPATSVYSKDCTPPPPPTPVNKPPVASILTDSTAHVGDTVTVDGSGSSDPDGTIISYLWSGANFINNTLSVTSFVMPNVSQVNVGLKVTDNNGSSASIATIVKNAATPPPPPVPTTTKVCLVGDLSGSSVPNKMNNCNSKIGLGDLGYKSDLSWFKSLNFDHCVIGNHDAPEDGSSSIYKEALAYCGDHWSLKTANSTTLLIGMNTNGDVGTQVQAVKTAISQNPGVKNIILISHKGGHVPPNSHHPAEAKSLYQQIEPLVPANVKLIEVVGHNHVMSSAPAQNWYQSGAGGKSHYSCGTDNTWTFCDNSNYGYLELTVDNSNGATTAKFVN